MTMDMITLHPSARHERPYSILVGDGVLAGLAKAVRGFGSYDAVAVLHDQAVGDIARSVAASLDAACVIAVAGGESSKSLSEAERIASVLLERGITRQSLLVNVGGGMLTDLGGFVASVYMRGIDCVHVPTTLLAMVDASVGGKTGVNVRGTKNIVGHFHHPKAVFADIAVLATLPDAQLREGLVEVIKIAAVADRAFFETLERDLPRLMGREKDALCVCIANAVRLKARIVEADERDGAGRLLLNFGHTVGHALEALSSFRLSHAQAVSIGMACEMDIAKTEDATRVLALLRALEMPTTLPTGCRVDDLMKAMRHDKKALHGQVRFAAPTTIGAGAVFPLDPSLFLCRI